MVVFFLLLKWSDVFKKTNLDTSEVLSTPPISMKQTH